MAELIGGKGKVAMVVHDQTSQSGIQRRDGFLDQMKENAPEIEILDPQYGGGDQLKSTDLAKAIITANPDLKGIYVSNEGSAIGVINAVEESGPAGSSRSSASTPARPRSTRSRPAPWPGDHPEPGQHRPRDWSWRRRRPSDGENLPKTIDTGFYWYDKTNVDEADIKAVLYD